MNCLRSHCALQSTSVLTKLSAMSKLCDGADHLNNGTSIQVAYNVCLVLFCCKVT